MVVSPIKAHVSARCYTGDHYCVDGALWSVSILETPLIKRAWVFQERTLDFLSCYFPSCPILRQKSFRLVGRVLRLKNCLKWRSRLRNDSGLLSHRVLHFGRHPMFWECQELDACETFTGGLPLLMKEQFGGSKRLLTEAGDLHKIRWIPIVRSYSGRSLTVPSNKAVAFAGIVEELQASSDSSYFAGFWRKGLERQL